MSHLKLVDDSWSAEEIEVLRGLRDTLQSRVENGDRRATPALQVVIVFIAELEGPRAAGLNV